MSPPGFGGAPYSSPQERTLTSITDGREQTPKSAEEISRMLQTQQAQIRFLASNQKQMQKGINEATQNPIQQLQQFISDLVVLFGGGQLAQGVLDFGDLTYILPALGALFGFGDGPFPLNLIAAAEKFFFGYVVPTQAWTDLLNHFIGTWLEAFGIDEKFVADVKALVTAVGELFDGVTGLLPNVNEFFGALGITAAGLGPLGLALAPIIKLFEAIDIKKFGNAVEFITDAIDPWIVQLTSIINFTNAVLHILGSGEDVLNSPLPQLTAPWANLIKFLGGINFAIANFNPLAAAQQFIGRLLIPLGGISEVQPDLQLDSSFDESSSIAEDSPAWAPQDLDPLVDYPEGWLWDLVGRNAPGSATVDCDGANHALLGTEIPVVEGQTFAPECWLTWSGVTAAGSTFRLQVMTDGGSATDIAAVSSPAASAGWTHLSGTYTVPAGVATIRTRLYVSGNATAGQVWFDDAPIRRTNLMQKGFIQGLVDDLTELFGNFAAMIDGILGTGHTFSDLVTFIASGLSLAAEAADNFTALLSGLSLANITSLVSFLATASSNAVDAIGALGDLVANALQVDAAGVGTLIASLLTMLTQISDIFNGSVVTPVNTVVQQIKDWWAATGAVLPAAITNAGAAVGDIADIISNAAQSTAAQVGAALAGAVDGIDDVVNNALNDAGVVATAFGMAVQGAWNTIVNAWIPGFGATAATPATVATAAANSASTVGQHSADISAIQAALASANSGSVGDLNAAVEIDPNGSLPSEFDDDGTIVIGGTTYAIAEYNAAETPTDEQIVTIIPSNISAHLLLRKGGDSFVFAQVAANGCTIYAIVSGVATVIGSASWPIYFLPGRSVSVAVGPDDYNFKVSVNGILKGTITDSVPVSQKGSDYRSIGYSEFDDDPPLDIGLPGRYTQWGVYGPGVVPGGWALLPDNPNTSAEQYWPTDTPLILRGNPDLEWERRGPIHRWIAPPYPGWTPVNQGSASLTLDNDSLLIETPSSSGDDTQLHAFVRSMANTSNYSIESYLEVTPPAVADFWHCGMLLRNSSTGYILMMSVVQSSGVSTIGSYIGVAHWNGYTTSGAAAYINQSLNFWPEFPHFMRFREDGTDRYFEVSINGVDWRSIWLQTRSTHTIPDQYGFFVRQNTGWSQPLSLRVRSINEY
ncbi:hypothetical protein MMRN_41560 [Mycobacterium marinum]|uniref:DUF7257 domain-containing protein n=2 Tax=Mycobacterium marinum TaxID=1781 RepID=UPI000CD7EB53|nr:hypothetical protein [Mycobacterium marinum]AXN51224.1 hypothetical protein CCUG20998_03828 [Mycobacterium marinum]RFZ25970.1 hypothetical protein DSM43519_01284 [Mycobacterium marinum]RFZ28849.1 hypothetical protein DSM44344_01116 [Mycobacterium marinum]WOR03231.1 hypothetical protein QDR78_18815 [Mycobacterium marinum]BBC67260.1 hypothetical protein MMRN_41560 [Mycobacterium marinum]